MGAIDIVCNLFTEREVREKRTGIEDAFLDQIRFPSDLRDGVSLDDYVARMDRAGIERSLLVAVRGGDLRVRGSFEVPYAYVREACERYPDRFSGLAGIDPTRGMAGLRELDDAVREHGFVGAHFYPHWFELPPDHARVYPYYAKCCELDIPIMMQVGQSLIYQRDRRLRSVGRPICLDAVACDFPELKLLGIHIGIPWTDEMIAMAWKHENVFIGTDAHAPRHWPEALVRYLDSWGRAKVLFGTDWPVIDPERAMKEVEALEIRPESRRALLSENARRVFGLPETSAA